MFGCQKKEGKYQAIELTIRHKALNLTQPSPKTTKFYIFKSTKNFLGISFVLLRFHYFLSKRRNFSWTRIPMNLSRSTHLREKAKPSSEFLPNSPIDRRKLQNLFKAQQNSFKLIKALSFDEKSSENAGEKEDLGRKRSFESETLETLEKLCEEQWSWIVRVLTMGVWSPRK